MTVTAPAGRRRRALVGLLVAAGLLLACAPAREAPPGVLGHDGAGFTLEGRPWPLLGMNVYNAASDGNCWYDMRDRLGPTLDTLSTASAGSLNVIRVWFFQNLATVGGERDWTAFDRVLRTAAEKRFRVIPVLTDQWGACEGRGAGYKSRAWYESGYRRTAGAPASYRDWAREVVTRYRDDPTVALWSLVNEAEAAESRSGACRSSAHRALRAFTDDMASVVDAADPRHLLALGTIGEGQCGAVGSEFADLHASPSIDVCEYHDYDDPEVPVPGDEANGLATRIAQCAELGKPLLVGEAGIDPAEVGGLEARADLLRAKAVGQRRAGVAGFLAWGWVAPGQESGDPYGIGPGDPALSVLAESP